MKSMIPALIIDKMESYSYEYAEKTYTTGIAGKYQDKRIPMHELF